tara:strand:+ start:1940 stop:2914 length:975 start_codon:yes stop_codon:yes gene_type:complete
MVRTGAHAYIKYGWEGTTYGVLDTSEVADKKFGLADKMSSLSLTNNKVNLAQLNKNTVHKYAYGQQSGSASMSFTLSNPWIIGSILGAPTASGSSPNYIYTYDSSLTTFTKTPRTIQVEVGYDGLAAPIVRTLKGGIVGALSITASVGGLVDCSSDITYGVETAPSATLGTAPVLPAIEFPYTFAHATLEFRGATVLQCQDASISMAQNAELLYGLSSHSAAAAYKRVLDITGSFKASWLNKDALDDMLAQVSLSSPQEMVTGIIKLSFVKNATNEKIVIELSGVTLNDLGISGLEPIEPLFEDISFTAKNIKVTATSLTSSAE